MPKFTPTCICCGKEMKFIRSEKLPAYGYCEQVFDRFECKCGNAVDWRPVPAGPLTATEVLQRNEAYFDASAA